MKTIKKDFQKTIKAIREENGLREYPKPMMTEVQMKKKEATVNCGGEWKTAETTKNIANIVLEDTRFKDFIRKYGAIAKIELNNFNTYQIRIKF